MPGLQEFPLPGLSNGECEFWVDVTSIDDSLTSFEIESAFNATTTITQPVFVPTMSRDDPLYDARVIGLDADALLVVDSERITAKTIVEIELTLHSSINAQDTLLETYSMAITFGYCLTDFTGAQLRGLKFEYFIRTPAVDL
jgi:hypothetical protein